MKPQLVRSVTWYLQSRMKLRSHRGMRAMIKYWNFPIRNARMKKRFWNERKKTLQQKKKNANNVATTKFNLVVTMPTIKRIGGGLVARKPMYEGNTSYKELACSPIVPLQVLSQGRVGLLSFKRSEGSHMQQSKLLFWWAIQRIPLIALKLRCCGELSLIPALIQQDLDGSVDFSGRSLTTIISVT